MITYNIINSSIGKLGIKIKSDALTNIEYLDANAAITPQTNSLIINITKQLERYFINPKYKFDLPFNLQGTKFQKRVWKILRNIPSGLIKTYGELAKQLNTSPRAIGNACRYNPIPIIIPCHRVIAKKSLGGYAGKQEGKMMDIKKWLLEHEHCP
jgi:methylated-DNA-[protein]-cysteine S-methyltransferase